VSAETFSKKHPLNEEGSVYVTASCNGCAKCCEIVPDIFRLDEATSKSFVFNQPGTEQEVEDALATLDVCPTESIYTDGDAHDQDVVSEVEDDRRWWQFWR
jgi:ferredoxin